MSEALYGFTSDELAKRARGQLSRGAGAARAIYRQAVRHGEFEPAREGLSLEAVTAWQTHYHLQLPPVVRQVEEPGELGSTAKAVLGLASGGEIECVHIPMGRGRSTLCISSQVGCKMGCTFCETGRMGLLRSLRTDEIISQLLVARHVLGWDFRNVVFMGMGEALDNTDALLPALRIMTDPGGLAISQEHITVCTVGHVDGIRQLAQLGFKRLNLSVSLNSARDAERSRIMPVGRKWPLAELQQVLAEYRQRDNFALGVNYCLLPGINDSEGDLDAVAHFVEPLGRCLVNIIPYNPGSDPVTRAPTEEEVVHSIEGLRDRGLKVRRRITKGREVMAACGQLGNLELKRAKRSLL